MTRSFSLVLAAANTWYNLWNLIVTNFGTNWDPTFTSLAYVPSRCTELSYQSQNAITNAANGGAVISVAFDNQLQSGEDLLSGSADKISGNIDLQTVSFKSSIGGAGINVTILSR